MKRVTREWVVKAEDDYLAASQLANHKPPVHDVVCFHCQQCAEKYLKALLEESTVPIPKTHDLVRLFHLLPPPYALRRSFLRGLDFLTGFAVGIRYPSMRATKRGATAALRWAGRIRDAARGFLGLPL
jgi:HEPN domain-containing protein